ncbi:MAG: tRNA epoxyqueuosine(34) reductase QueG [Rhodocyclaceae bacterium]|nr:tRNA epoxyqueuosine(34) reductase QueG [Rhodocyclaceae bacterium]
MHDWARLKNQIKGWGRELGFSALAVAAPELAGAAAGLDRWLAAGFHGEMDYMTRHADLRARPEALVPGTRSIIVARMDYLPARPAADATGLSPLHANISRYAWGRDYHKLLRQRLQKLAERIQSEIGPFAHRAFTDSAPVMEVELAVRAGLGWRGKHTLLLNREAGSWFFLGELFTDLPLPVDGPVTDHCGSCRACLDACPTAAFTGPHELDARRCISYLTIELQGSIPEELRPLLGNRIYGCDDCQQVCPWNRFAPLTAQPDFLPRHGLDSATLIELFAWDEATFNERLAGSPIRRIGHGRWLRNLAVGLGNAPTTPEVIAALEARRDDGSALVREHVAWALTRHRTP